MKRMVGIRTSIFTLLDGGGEIYIYIYEKEQDLNVSRRETNGHKN